MSYKWFYEFLRKAENQNSILVHGEFSQNRLKVNILVRDHSFSTYAKFS